MKYDIKNIKKYYRKNKKNVDKAAWIVGAVFILALYSLYQVAAPQISIFSADQVVEEFGKITVMWRIDSKEGTATNMAVYYDYQSFPRKFTKSISPLKSGYLQHTNSYVSGTVNVPGEYVDQIKVPYGVDAVYLRVYALVNGKNMWTDEFKVDVLGQEPLDKR